MPSLKYAGVMVEIGEEKYILPGLAIRQLRDNAQLLTRLNELEQQQVKDELPVDGMVEVFGTIAKIVGLALRRNYPDMDDEKLEDLIDTSNARFLVNAVMGQSGLKMTREIAAVQAGETKTA